MLQYLTVGPEDNSVDPVLSFHHHTGSRDRTRVTGLAWETVYPLSFRCFFYKEGSTMSEVLGCRGTETE